MQLLVQSQCKVEQIRLKFTILNKTRLGHFFSCPQKIFMHIICDSIHTKPEYDSPIVSWALLLNSLKTNYLISSELITSLALFLSNICFSIDLAMLRAIVNRCLSSNN
jgi:hypothetical protein